MKMLIVGCGLIGSLVISGGSPAFAAKPCAGLTGSERTACLQRELQIAQDINRDTEASYKAYDNTYKAAKVTNSAIRRGVSVVRGGGAVHAGSQIVTDQVIKSSKPKK